MHLHAQCPAGNTCAKQDFLAKRVGNSNFGGYYTKGHRLWCTKRPLLAKCQRLNCLKSSNFQILFCYLLIFIFSFIFTYSCLFLFTHHITKKLPLLSLRSTLLHTELAILRWPHGNTERCPIKAGNPPEIPPILLLR